MGGEGEWSNALEWNSPIFWASVISQEKMKTSKNVRGANREYQVTA